VTIEVMQQIDRDFIAQLEASPYPMAHLIHDARLIVSLPP
jgi:hypothetical protein